jgi:hypothetical protein
MRHTRHMGAHEVEAFLTELAAMDRWRKDHRSILPG